MFQANNYSERLFNLCSANAAVSKMYLFGSALAKNKNCLPNCLYITCQ